MPGHAAAFCSKPFMRQLCGACGRMGHSETDCPARRHGQREAAKAERRSAAATRAEARAACAAEGPLCYLCGQLGHVQSACPLRHRPVCLECGQPGHVRRSCPTLPPRGTDEQPRSRPARVVDDDAKSELSVATFSTAASTASAAGPAPEEKEIKRLEKKLRDISKLEACAAAGERLEVLQLEKVKQRADMEIELGTLRGLAEARARNAARKATA